MRCRFVIFLSFSKIEKQRAVMVILCDKTLGDNRAIPKLLSIFPVYRNYLSHHSKLSAPLNFHHALNFEWLAICTQFWVVSDFLPFNGWKYSAVTPWKFTSYACNKFGMTKERTKPGTHSWKAGNSFEFFNYWHQLK